MIVFDVKYITLESIYDSILSLFYILYMAPVAFQAIYQVVPLACATSHDGYLPKQTVLTGGQGQWQL